MKIHRIIANMMAENTYVVSDETGECVIIDCGCQTEGEQRQLSDYISANNLRPTRLLCTHFHLDHIFGNGYVERTYGLRAEATEADHLLYDMIHYQLVAFGMEDGAVDIPEPTYTLREGETVSFGTTELKILSTPGHTPGGVSFYSEKEGILFSGDTLMKGAVGATNLPGARKSKLHKSVASLFALPATTTLYPGHGDSTTIADELATNPIVAELNK